MAKKAYTWAALLVLLSLIIAGCGGDGSESDTPTSDSDQVVSTGDVLTPTATAPPDEGEPERGEANIQSVQIMLLESFPVQVHVLARGEHPDGCTHIDEVQSLFSDNNFDVTVSTIRPGGAACTEALVPFEENIALDVLGLEAGSYTVNVNGVTGSFTLDVDNRPQLEPTIPATPEPTATPAPDPDSGSISGTVWHDLCSVALGVGEEPAVPSEGCITAVDGVSFQANGLLESGEPGISGLLVSLTQGECPGDDLVTSLTGDDGFFSFTSLAAGSYCVSVDALSDYNSVVLVPGAWTYPDSNVDSVTIILSEGEAVTDVDFGWDYQFLPLPDVDPDTCLNSIEFVEDLTVPDDTAFAPGEEFVKSWRLRNIGTCPWTTDYSLTRVGGDGIGEIDSQPLPSAVAPGQTIDLSVQLTAPDVVGTYRDNWQLSNAAGTAFGVGGFADEAFWVQIVVTEPLATPVPGSASVGGVVWSDSCRLLQNGTPSAGCVETAEDSGIFVGDGTLNFGELGIPGLTVILSDQACPEEGAIAASDVVATATTGDDGVYNFPNLDGGTYCVAIEAFDEANVEILIPGDWTWPAPGVGRLTVFLDGGESLLEIDFGWDDRSD